MSAIDIFGWTHYRDHIPAVNVLTTGFHPTVTGRFGLKISPDIPFYDVAVALATNGANIAAMEVERHHEWADIFLEVGATVSGYTTIKACCQLLQKRESKTQKRRSRLRS